MTTVADVTLATSPVSGDNERTELRRAAEAFEALMLQSLIKRMRESQLENGFFGESAGTSVYESMFDQYLSERLSEGSPLGIAEQLEAQWTTHVDGRAEASRLLREADRARALQVFESMLDGVGLPPAGPVAPDRELESRRPEESGGPSAQVSGGGADE